MTLTSSIFRIGHNARQFVTSEGVLYEQPFPVWSKVSLGTSCVINQFSKTLPFAFASLSTREEKIIYGYPRFTLVRNLSSF